METRARSGGVAFPLGALPGARNSLAIADLARVLDRTYGVQTRGPRPGTLEVEFGPGRAMEWIWQDAGLVGRALIDEAPQRFAARVEAPEGASVGSVAAEIVAMSRRVLNRF